MNIKTQNTKFNLEKFLVILTIIPLIIFLSKWNESNNIIFIIQPII